MLSQIKSGFAFPSKLVLARSDNLTNHDRPDRAAKAGKPNRRLEYHRQHKWPEYKKAQLQQPRHLRAEQALVAARTRDLRLQSAFP